MKGTSILGVVLLVVGLVVLAKPVISWTQRERVVDVGPIKIDADKEKNVWIPPLAGVLAVAAGVVLVASARRTA